MRCSGLSDDPQGGRRDDLWVLRRSALPACFPLAWQCWVAPGGRRDDLWVLRRSALPACFPLAWQCWVASAGRRVDLVDVLHLAPRPGGCWSLGRDDSLA